LPPGGGGASRVPPQRRAAPIRLEVRLLHLCRTGERRRRTAGRRGGASHESSAGALHVGAAVAAPAPAVDLDAGRNGCDAGR
jgi:hypothetical protein